MKKVVVVQSAIIAVLLLLSGVLVIAQANGISLSSILNDSNVSYIEFGDEFSGFDLWDHEGKAVTKISKGKKYTVTFYLSSSCSSCLDSIFLILRGLQLPLVTRLIMRLFGRIKSLIII